MTSVRILWFCAIALALTVGAPIVHGADADGGLDPAAAPDKPAVRLKPWSAPSVASTVERLRPAAESLERRAEALAAVEALASVQAPLPGDELSRRVASCIGAGDPRVEALLAACERGAFGEIGDAAWLSELPKYAADNVRLAWGAALTRSQLYDEAKDKLEALTADDVADPAGLLFYQGVVFHRLLDKERASASLESLLEQEASVARRHASMARLMLADLAPFKPDSLDEVSRMMDDVKRRLGLGRAGKQVRDEEDQVVEKLDKLIKKLEDQQQQQQQQQQRQKQQQQQQQQEQLPQSPADKREGAPPLDPEGKVDPKDLGKKSGWGNLPPKQRQEALQQISKELPAHYRETVEEYFKRMAQDGAK